MKSFARSVEFIILFGSSDFYMSADTLFEFCCRGRSATWLQITWHRRDKGRARRVSKHRDVESRDDDQQVFLGIRRRWREIGRLPRDSLASPTIREAAIAPCQQAHKSTLSQSFFSME